MDSDNRKIVRAADVMHKDLTIIDGMATAKDAAEKMRIHRVNELLVEKRHPDDAWGMIVVQDLIRGVLLAGQSSEEVNVYEIMSKPVITVPADMDVRYVARLLYRAGIRRAPVEEGGKLIGMISLASLVLENELF